MRFKFKVSHAVAKMLQQRATGKGRKESENDREKGRKREKEGEGVPAQVSDWLSSAGKRATGVGRQNMDRWTVLLGGQEGKLGLVLGLRQL